MYVRAPSGAELGYQIVVTRTAPPPPVAETVTETVTKTVSGRTRTVTRTETVTQTVEVPAQPNVIGGTGMAMATEVAGRVLITRHGGGPSLAIDIGGFIRDESFGQTYSATSTSGDPVPARPPRALDSESRVTSSLAALRGERPTGSRRRTPKTSESFGGVRRIPARPCTIIFDDHQVHD